MQEEFVEPVTKAINLAFKESIQNEITDLYYSILFTVDILNTKEGDTPEFVEQRYDHLLKANQRYISLDTHYLGLQVHRDALILREV